MKRAKAHIVRMPAHKETVEAPFRPTPETIPSYEVPPTSEDFPYPKTLFWQRVLLQIILITVVAILLSPFFLNVPLPWSAIILGLFAIYLIISAISPLLTCHTLTTDNLIIRQGWYFRSTIPTKDIESVEEVEEYGKVGVKFSLTRRKLYVTASRYGLVRIRLKEPKRFPLALGKIADEIIIDVEKRPKFIELANHLIHQHEILIPASPVQRS